MDRYKIANDTWTYFISHSTVAKQVHRVEYYIYTFFLSYNQIIVYRLYNIQ